MCYCKLYNAVGSNDLHLILIIGEHGAGELLTLLMADLRVFKSDLISWIASFYYLGDTWLT